MAVTRRLTRRVTEATIRLHARFVASPGAGERGDRGDVPGWVMITLMTAVLVVAIWGIASDQLRQLVNDAFDKVTNQSNAGS